MASDMAARSREYMAPFFALRGFGRDNGDNGDKQEIMVKVGRMTSSLLRKSKAVIAVSNAAEPFVTDIACLRPTI